MKRGWRAPTLVAVAATAFLTVSPSATGSYRSLEDALIIGAAGDISCARASDGAREFRDRATSDLVLRNRGIRHVLTLGDNQYEYGTLAEYRAYYDRTWGRFKGKTHPVTGNHDHGAGYYDYWGSRAGPRGKGYHAFNLGDWRAYAINSSISVGPGSTQYR